MSSRELFRLTALALPFVTEEPHFEKAAFKVNGKIFATLPPGMGPAMVKISPKDQEVFCTTDGLTVYPVPNTWGAKGATFVDLNKVSPELLVVLIKTAYCTVAPKNAALVDLN